MQSDVPVSEETTKITGITQIAVERFGYEQNSGFDSILEMVGQADAVSGHNVVRYDKRVIESWAGRLGRNFPDKLWIDTYCDLPLETKTGTLSHMAADHGFLNLAAHSALGDCETHLKLLSFYDIDKVVERAKSPTIILQGHQNRMQNSDAKKAKFRWQPQYKIWWRTIKTIDAEAFQKSLPFATLEYLNHTQEELEKET